MGAGDGALGGGVTNFSAVQESVPVCWETVEGILSSGVLSSCLYWPVSSRAMGPEPGGRGRDTVSSKQRNHSHKQSCNGACGLFCFLFKALVDELCRWPLLSLGFECYL